MKINAIRFNLVNFEEKLTLYELTKLTFEKMFFTFCKYLKKNNFFTRILN